MARLAIHEFGPPDGPPVLIVHGVTNTGARFRRLAEEHLAALRILAPDLRGHADSTWDPPWTAEQHVDDLIETLDAAGVGRVPVVGHSFGGLLATRLAARAPERVAAVGLIDPAIALPPPMASAYADGSRHQDAWGSPQEAREARAALRPPHAMDTVDDDLSTFLGRGEDGMYRLRFSPTAAICAWSDMARPPVALDGYPGRALLIEAGQAEFVTDALRARLRTDLGDRLEEAVIDAGHMLFWDAREELAAVLGPFIDSSLADVCAPRVVCDTPAAQ